MAVLVGSGFYLSTALGVGGVAAEGTVLSAADLGQVYDIQTDGTLSPGNNAMNAGDSFVVDTDDDGDFLDEAATTQTDNDRYVNSTVTYADGSTSNVTLELISLSDGTQAILVNDAAANNINAASDEIQSITLGTFNTRFNNRYNQANFNNEITNTVVCFCDKTLIRTPTGERRIGTLTVGDAVKTAEDGNQKIVWIGKRTLSSAQLVASPHLKPVRIRAGALGQGIPRSDLLVSPQHRILLVTKIAERMFGQKEIFVPAIKLLGAEGIEQVTSVAPVTYSHVLFEKHQVVFANGAQAESLYTGPEALQALSDEARKEIFEILPELQRRRGLAFPLARPVVQKQALVSKLLARHRQNRKPLVLLESSNCSV
jgi:hypothetical protein